LNSFQKQVDRLTSSWSDARPESLMMLLTEELGELARALRKLGVKRWGHEDEAIGSKEDVAEELGDLLFLIARVALITGVDLDDAAFAAIGKIERRLAASE
jgi:NTP pyrophosphatase (non-canonical NTP hydrolase)